MANGATSHDPLKGIIRRCIPALAIVGVVTLITTVSFLVVPIYMMQVYDRVVASGSFSTLFALGAITLFALLVSTALDYARSRLLRRMAIWFSQRTGIDAIEAGIRQSVASRNQTAQSLRDIGEIRNFIQGSSIVTGFELLWTPVFFIVLFAIHFYLGVLGLVSAGCMIMLSYLSEIVSRRSLFEAEKRSLVATATIGNSLRNAEAVEAMGMSDRIIGRWQKENDIALDLAEHANSRLAVIGAFSRTFLLYVKVVVVTVAVILVLNNEMSAGAIFAAFIVTALMLTPFSKLIDTYRQVIGARAAWGRLRTDLTIDSRDARLPSPMPRPTGAVTVDSLVYAPPGFSHAVIRGISFAMSPGEVVGIAGPSAAGKSTLARLLMGIVKPTSGSVRIDGTSVFQWERRSFGSFTGYIPQSVSLFDGTVRENISRFTDVPIEDVIAAAKRAGAHEMIGHLPFGYDTRIGDTGYTLTGGQRQRIALARALFGEPRYIVLDEPDASLDQEGERALLSAMRAAADNGATVVVISHRASVLQVTDKILILKEGRIQFYGWRDKALEELGLLPAPGPERRLVKAVDSHAGR
ncbi:ABC transporter ATP-binding protein [Thalassobaculum fulvum]|uniref:ABC transporter ATP-binding protein n=1 Tax=Thalassobaculum fulvum TaxID=1633335 RepID=A0A919CPF6_9PROT|nr:type I secretion system permease/ATPase [Thalassobaculum fulvum]GHD50000.1 ABC transporter ATP-binding protein [Thalassobaculum fulvum]